LFKAIIKVETLREISSISSAITKEIRATFSKDGIDLKAVDGAHIGMINLNYKEKVFNMCDGDPSDLCFEVDKFSKSLSLAKPDTIVELSYDIKDNRLIMKMGDITRSMTLLSQEAVPKIPDMQKLAFPDYIIVKTDDVMQGIRSSGIIASDEIEIELTPEQGLHMFSSNHGDAFDIKLAKERLQKFDIKESCKSLFPLKMLSDLFNELRNTEQVILYLGNDFPLRIQWDLSNGTGTGRFMLAPRTRTAE
jgi:proliferating cell nuclear antigen